MKKGGLLLSYLQQRCSKVQELFCHFFQRFQADRWNWKLGNLKIDWKFLIISQAYKKVGLCFSYNDENILFNPQSLYQLNLSTKHHPHLSLITLMCGQGCKWEANRRGIKRPSLLILDLRDEICRILKTKRKVRSSMGCRFLEWMMISQIGFVNWVVILGQGGG